MLAVRTLTVALCLAVTALATHAQPSSPRTSLTNHQIGAIDQFVKSEMARQHIPGLAVGVYSRGKVLLAKGYGLADVELDAPVKPQTIFNAGSIGKQFVSAAIMLLVEDGKLSLDDSITKYFPEAPASWKPIRIGNLLSHTSGLSDYGDYDDGPTDPFYERLDFTEDELTTKIEAMPIEWAPGEKWAYCNTNYVVLGILIHKITGKSYAEFLGERIFKPLGMTSSGLANARDIVHNRASGYATDNGELKNEKWVSPTFSATADGARFSSTVLDFAKWDAALYTTRLLSQASLDRMWTVYKLNDGQPNPAHYGFGWIITQFHGHKDIEHSGKTWGFTSTILRYPDDSLTVAVLTNQRDADAQMIADVVAGLIDPPVLPAKLRSMPDNDPSIAGSVRTLMDQIVGGIDFRAQTTPDVTMLITPDATRRWQRRLAPFWPGGTVTLVAREPSPTTPNQVNSIFRVSKGGKAVLISYNRTSTGKIHGLDVSDDRTYQ